jgi:hypothetical protein
LPPDANSIDDCPVSKKVFSIQAVTGMFFEVDYLSTGFQVFIINHHKHVLGTILDILKYLPRRVPFEISCFEAISKEIRRAEHENMNIHTPPPPNSPLVFCYYRVLATRSNVKFYTVRQ